MKLPSALYINGRGRDGSGEPMVVDDPSSGQEIAALGSATSAEIDEAVHSAAAVTRPWGERPAHERGRLCRRVADLIRSNREWLTELGVRVAGLPPRLARAGQACSAGTRVLVPAERRDELYDRLGAAICSLTIGPAAEDPNVGPVISARQRDVVKAAVADAERHGARALVGRGVPQIGYFISPTILDNVDPTADAAQQEIFGSVLTVLEFEAEEDAVAIANGTDYGLLAGVWTRDLPRAVRLTRALKAGQVHVNGHAIGGGMELPFGGYKRSGIGRVKGLAGALEYTQLKTVVLTSEGSTA